MDHDTQAALRQATALLERGMAQIEHARRLITALAAPTGAATPVVSPAEEKLRECAYRHQLFLTEHGGLTQADSLAIRRELYGPDAAAVRNTANQFGRGEGANKNFYRLAPHGTKVQPGQQVRLTTRGAERAELYRRAHRLG